MSTPLIQEEHARPKADERRAEWDRQARYREDDPQDLRACAPASGRSPHAELAEAADRDSRRGYNRLVRAPFPSRHVRGPTPEHDQLPALPESGSCFVNTTELPADLTINVWDGFKRYSMVVHSGADGGVGLIDFKDAVGPQPEPFVR